MFIVIFQYSRPSHPHSSDKIVESSIEKHIQVSQSFMEETKKENAEMKRTIAGLEDSIKKLIEICQK